MARKDWGTLAALVPAAAFCCLMSQTVFELGADRNVANHVNLSLGYIS